MLGLVLAGCGSEPEPARHPLPTSSRPREMPVLAPEHRLLSPSRAVSWVGGRWTLEDARRSAVATVPWDGEDFLLLTARPLGIFQIPSSGAAPGASYFFSRNEGPAYPVGAVTGGRTGEIFVADGAGALLRVEFRDTTALVLERLSLDLPVYDICRLGDDVIVHTSGHDRDEVLMAIKEPADRRVVGRQFYQEGSGFLRKQLNRGRIACLPGGDGLPPVIVYALERLGDVYVLNAVGDVLTSFRIPGFQLGGAVEISDPVSVRWDLNDQGGRSRVTRLISSSPTTVVAQVTTYWQSGDIEDQLMSLAIAVDEVSGVPLRPAERWRLVGSVKGILWSIHPTVGADTLLLSFR